MLIKQKHENDIVPNLGLTQQELDEYVKLLEMKRNIVHKSLPNLENWEWTAGVKIIFSGEKKLD